MTDPHDHGNQHTLDHPMNFRTTYNPRSKHFFQNCCRVAIGKCNNCKAPDCKDRDWRAKGREVP